MADKLLNTILCRVLAESRKNWSLLLNRVLANVATNIRFGHPFKRTSVIGTSWLLSFYLSLAEMKNGCCIFLKLPPNVSADKEPPHNLTCAASTYHSRYAH